MAAIGGRATAPAPSWTPLDDVANISALFLPNGFSAPYNATTGIWSDLSGNGFHATFSAVKPTESGGYPIMGSTDKYLVIAASFNGDLASSASGAIVAIAEYTAALDTYVGNYQNPAIIEGSAATPGLVADDSGLRLEGYDAANYVEKIVAGFAQNTPALCAGKWDGLGVYTSLGGAAWSARQDYTIGQTSLDGTNMGATTYMGCGFGNAYVWQGPIKALAIYPDFNDVDNAKLAQWQTWAAAAGLV